MGRLELILMSTWRNCSVCKTPIPLGAIYQKCSVSTCRKSAYCSVKCWDVHVPTMGHKTAWAEEERAPKNLDNEPRRRIVKSPSSTSSSNSSSSKDLPNDVLIVVSKMKSYVKAKADMNTSGDVADVLSDIVRRHLDDALMHARQDGRKTLMGRDLK